MTEETKDAVVIEHGTRTRVANLIVTVVPLALLGLAGWLAWGGALHWQDLVVLAITYTLTVVGVTVGYHGWMFRGIDRANPKRYAKDPLSDPIIRAINRTFPRWVLVGLLIPFGLGVALTGSLVGGLTGMLSGGAVRILFLHHATFSINSLCHFFGRRRFHTGDESRNLAWLAIPTFGEAWHNNHHAFPTSAHHGLTRSQLDPGGLLIDTLERLGLAWDVIRIPRTAQEAKLASELGQTSPSPLAPTRFSQPLERSLIRDRGLTRNPLSRRIMLRLLPRRPPE